MTAGDIDDRQDQTKALSARQKSRDSGHDHRDRQRGFALPLVLIAIVSMSVIAGVSFQIVSRSSDDMAAFTTQIDTEIALMSAEAETTFVYLSGALVPNGLITTSDPALLAALELDGVSPSSLTQYDVWRADGGVRLSGDRTQPVRATYRDGAGYAPITALSLEDTADLLRVAGFRDDRAVQLAARLADFQDDNNARQFRGAEAPEYRLYQKRAPTNSPIRAPEELASVLGLMDAAPVTFWDFLDDFASVGSGDGLWRIPFAPPALADSLPLRLRPDKNSDAIEASLAEDAVPTGRARFLLETQMHNGQMRRRAIELTKTAYAPEQPMRRYWLYDKTPANGGVAVSGSEYDEAIFVFQERRPTVDDPDER